VIQPISLDNGKRAGHVRSSHGRSSCPISDDDANPSEHFKDCFNRFWQLFECPERTLNLFVLLIVSFSWQEHHALHEKSGSQMTTDDPIELAMNLHQSISPIGNNYIFSKKSNIPCSDRVYSYIPS
jgi:hypothetical protein